VAKPIGSVTRGTTNPNRLRRVDRYIAALPQIKEQQPVVVDLGFGASPITAIELRARLLKVNPGVRVVGVEIERERVERGLAIAEPGLDFTHGGFEVPLPKGMTEATFIRAFNVLRQYDESEVAAAWTLMQSRLSETGLLIEGTCDEIGRLSSWITLSKQEPLWFTISLKLGGLENPSKVAERLPKALIHHNVPGERIHDWLQALDRAWAKQAPLSTFGPVQRWLAVCEQLVGEGWPIKVDRKRWRLGELTLAYEAVRP
jgi:hypothetical protein